MKQIFLFLVVVFFSSSFNELFSQDIQTKPTRQSSMEAFSKGNYEKAYNEFSTLLLTYSKDPLYKYYSGVCLIKLNRNSVEAVSLLQQALQGAAVVKSLPTDALFYLGQAQQKSGKFAEAIESYNLYSEQIGKKEAKVQGVSELIQQCREKKGQVAESEVNPTKVVEKGIVEVSKEENNLNVQDTIVQPVKKDVAPKMNLPSAIDKIIDEALVFQFKSDSLNALASEQKKKLENLPGNEKTALKASISKMELQAASFQKSANQKYSEAELAMNPEKEKAPQIKNSQSIDNKVVKDSVEQSDHKIVKDTDIHSDTIKKVVSGVKKPVEIFSFFEVLPKPVTDPKEKIDINPVVPAGLIYRIQVAVFRNPVAPAYFKGITPVYGFKIAGTDKTNYLAGMFRRSSDAKKALAIVKAKGFKDVFVIALFGNKPISAERAAILEKEWGTKPFVGTVKNIPETPIDTITPTLIFRVEVIRSVKPLKDDKIEGIRKIAGNRGMDLQSLDDGKFAYLIGKFITFETAAEYADLLIRNGYPEARVVAWLGNKEIPVETAKQLFNNLE